MDRSSGSALSCKTRSFCGNLVKIDCNSAIDGPLTYYDNRDASVVMRCGGACMIQTGKPKACTACPPPEWQCREDWLVYERTQRGDRLAAIRDRHELEPAYLAYEKLVEASIEQEFSTVTRACPEAERTHAFARIDASGRVEEVVVFNGEHEECITSGLKALRFPPPPVAPFAARFYVPPPAYR